jgi:hypothetical protein
MTTALRLAGIYNLLWGAYAVLFPASFWSLMGMDQPNYPFLWQCIGMIVGVYGIGYWFAASAPYTHWPIILVGFLGKIFGPIGFLQAHFIENLVPLRFGVTLLTNDLAWWVPFGLILAGAWKHHEALRAARLSAAAAPIRDERPEIRTALTRALTSTGLTLAAASESRPLLVVFLRHAGCTFCREALADLEKAKPRLDRAGVGLVLVHMGPDGPAAALFARSGLLDALRVSDPARDLYRAMELSRGTLSQLFGPRVWVRGFKAGLIDRHGVGMLVGDGLQMPGAFLIHRSAVLRAYRHEDAADRPDYCSLAGA